MNDTRNSAFNAGTNTHVRRKDRAGRLPEEAIAAIDEALICHVAFVAPQGPMCLPMAFARRGNALYLHGALNNRLLQSLQGTYCSVTFTHLDGLVLARSAFHQSMNYRAVVAMGRARLVTSDDEKNEALEAVVNHGTPGRSTEASAPTPAEVRSTQLLAIDVEEASLKSRSGPPADVPSEGPDEPWSGVIPLHLGARHSQRAPGLPWNVPPSPAHNETLRRFGIEAAIEHSEGNLLFSSDPSRLDLSWVHARLSQDAYWAVGVSRNVLERSLSRSVVFGVYRDGSQIGFARVLTDTARVAYLADVFIAENERSTGLGKRLVQVCMSHPDVAGCERVFLGTRDAQALYQRFGFVAFPEDRVMLRDLRRPPQ